MEATAKVTNVRIAPRKVQIVLDLIRNKPCEEALAILKYTPKAACEPLEKLLKSAMANATNNFGLDGEKLRLAMLIRVPLLRESDREIMAEHSELTKRLRTFILCLKKQNK